MPHRLIAPERCGRPHHYRSAEHLHGCDVDTWPHWHERCKRCGFTWLQPTLFDAATLEALT